MSGTTEVKVEVKGYFIWQRVNKGTPIPAKIGIEMVSGQMPETKKAFEASIIGQKFPLGDDEWKLGLDMLAARYPCTA